MTGLLRRRPLACYLLLAYGWTWGWQLPLLLSRRGLVGLDVSEGLEVIAAFGPLLAAVVVLAGTTGASGIAQWWAGLKRWRVGLPGLLLALASPVVLLAFAILAVGFGSGHWPAVTALEGGRLATAGGWLHLVVVAGLVQGVGEEPGWRGYLLPRLRERRSPWRATLLLYPAWLLWHLPAFLGRPEFGVPQFVAFALGILAAAVWLTYLMEITGSTLMAVAWHALINIVRGIALALSMPAFLTISTLVMLGALLIAAVWVRRGRAPA